MTRLSNAVLPQMPAGIGLPAYDRSKLSAGIVHLGFGREAAATLGPMMDGLMATQPGWAVIGARLNPGDLPLDINAQDGLYTLVTRDTDSVRYQLVGSVLEVLDAGNDKAALLDRMADPATRIVSLTIGGRAYCRIPSTGEMDVDHPELEHDLEHPESPVGAGGLIAEALFRRFKAGHEPFTVLSLDELPDNGAAARQLVLWLAERRDADFARWIAAKGAFPNAVVDRLVAGPTPKDRDLVTAVSGFVDQMPVVTEARIEFAFEDCFAAGRPDFEAVGAMAVADITPVQLRHQRLMGGAKSTLAYLGQLHGFDSVAEALGDEDLSTLVRDMMTREILPLLTDGGSNGEAEVDAVLSRLGNAALGLRTATLAADGSYKVPHRLVASIRDRLQMGEPSIRLSLAVAGWIRYASGFGEEGEEIEVRDPLADRLHFLAQQAHTNPDAMSTAFLSLYEIFGDDLPNAARFRQRLTNQLGQLLHQGVESTVDITLHGREVA